MKSIIRNMLSLLLGEKESSGKNWCSSVIVVVVLFVVMSCQNAEQLNEAPQQTDEDEYLGGSTTISDISENAFALPARNLSSAHKDDFYVGNSFFNKNWVIAPASTTARDGLGPLFNARSCSGCHFKDGRGRGPEENGDFVSILLRLSIPGNDEHGGPLPEPNYGGQLQNFAIDNVPAEGKPRVVYTEKRGEFPDGEVFWLRVPTYSIEELSYGTLSPSVMISPRVAPQMIGLGLLEAIPEAQILALADETDRNGDQISGKANYVWDAASKSLQLGRFGWKANKATIPHQVAGALNGDIGLTTTMISAHGFSDVQRHLEGLPNGGSPEVSDSVFHALVVYSRTLAVPARRNIQQPEVRTGKQIFMSIGCASCHNPSFTTGQAEIAELSNQKIFPYTDLLLHDLGEELADKRPDFRADGREWRTAPLWGIGLFHAVNKHTNYMHDGRARNLQEAILWHGGEAESSRQSFMKLPKTQRGTLLQFLESL